MFMFRPFSCWKESQFLSQIGDATIKYAVWILKQQLA